MGTDMYTKTVQQSVGGAREENRHFKIKRGWGEEGGGSMTEPLMPKEPPRQKNRQQTTSPYDGSLELNFFMRPLPLFRFGAKNTTGGTIVVEVDRANQIFPPAKRK